MTLTSTQVKGRLDSVGNTRNFFVCNTLHIYIFEYIVFTARTQLFSENSTQAKHHFMLH